jgi:hypothetical protein
MADHRERTPTARLPHHIHSNLLPGGRQHPPPTGSKNCPCSSTFTLR